MDTNLTGSNTVFNVPRSHWHCQLDNFEWGAVAPNLLRAEVLRFLNAAADEKASHLILTGLPGIGKTHLGIGAYRWMVRYVGTALTMWLNVPAFCDKVKKSYNTDHDPFADYKVARQFVVLDDMFGRDLTMHESQQIVVRLLDIAYQNGAAVLLTMNPEVAELAGLLRPHEASRLLASATIIPIKGQDWRVK